MKKISVVLIALSIIVFLTSCGDPVLYDVSISNNSSKTIAYRYNDSSDTLSPNDSRDYQIKAYTQKPSNISVVPSGTLTVKLIYKNETYFFEDVDPINLNVVNTLPFAVTINADNYIDADGSGKTDLLISANSETQGTKIYTARPRFTIAADYPTGSIKVEWELRDTTIYVIIK